VTAGFRRLTGLTILFSYALIVLGAVVRVTDSGISCPDWPRCYGIWLLTPSAFAAIPDTAYTYGQVMLEWTHRLIAGFVVGPLVVALTVWAFRLRGEVPALAPLMVTALVLVVIQAGLGGFTVLDRNSPWSVAVHLTVALIFLATLIRVYLAARADGGAPADALPRRIATLTGIAVLAALATMASGAMMAKSGASLACASWPLCNETLLPDLADPLVFANVVHRLLVLVTALLIGVLFVAGRARRTTAPGFHHVLSVAAVLVVIEVAFGATVVFLLMPLWTAIVHQAVGILVFAVLAAAYLRRHVEPAAEHA
jgi:heme A synthase